MSLLPRTNVLLMTVSEAEIRALLIGHTLHSGVTTTPSTTWGHG